MATITHDTLDWYGWDADGGGIHDVIGTRCDPYTQLLLGGSEYHHCCHSNLTRALAAQTGLPLSEAERHVHDVLNVCMCTGFTRDPHQYFMKASPVRPGDSIAFFAEIDLRGALSACPGGDCSATHSSDTAMCYPLKVEVHRLREAALNGNPLKQAGTRVGIALIDAHAGVPSGGMEQSVATGHPIMSARVDACGHRRISIDPSGIQPGASRRGPSARGHHCAIRLVEHPARRARALAHLGQDDGRADSALGGSYRHLVGRTGNDDLQRRLFGICRRPASRLAGLGGARGLAGSRRLQ